MEHEELTEKIIGCAYHVYNTLRPGFLESVYQNAMVIALRKGGLGVEPEVPINVFYEGECVGEFYADLLVNDIIIVELKAVSTTIKAHEVQVVNYLSATRKPVGLLINFGDNGVEIKRKYRDYKPRQ